MNQSITEFVAALILFQVLLAIWNNGRKRTQQHLSCYVPTELSECTPFTKLQFKKRQLYLIRAADTSGRADRYVADNPRWRKFVVERGFDLVVM